MLKWNCQHCLTEVADGKGYIAVNEREALDRPRLVAAWELEVEKKRPTPANCLRTYSFDDLLACPDRVEWRIAHFACEPDRRDAPDYVIRVERIRTARHVLDWTAHLWDKAWVRQTAWPEILRAAQRQMPGQDA